jgi:small ligand-binding sensory domain FIST
LVFTCNGRGQHLFGAPNHDAGVVAELLGPVPAAGAFCAGEIGPIGGRNFLHGFTASLALFT